MTGTVLVTGAGGVGKTTFSAALAVTAARRGVRTLVVTVDPARRLASALGLAELGDEPQPHDDEPELWAAMLDSAASWRAVAMRHADPEVASRLADNEFFKAASEHFPASQSYAAADQAATFVQARAWDMVIVDTPPSGGGIDFFTAPAQMADLVGGRLLRWITGGPLPGRRFFFDRAARPILRVADTILGSGLLERVSEFLLDLRTTYDGVARRGREIERVLADASILVVTTADPAPVTEAVRFYRQLPDLASVPAAVVFNRALPSEWATVEADPGWSLEVSRVVEQWSSESIRQADAREEFSTRYGANVAMVPWRPNPPNDLDGLAGLLDDSDGIPWERLLP
ncbi:MAG TPA: ArsA-related P-loop ATPase [Acidimicrobiia bacterium]|jgi:anion-transporting  ArsA/GET3 family ATPase|nr:ArsA-related P-loop ATPase [Acidimicrobiia bacterium]